jgi:DNA sulfur modification protein DndC
MARNQLSLWEDERRSLGDALELTAQSLTAYGLDYRHWAIAYSGGKDSTATLAAVTYLLRSCRVPRPESLTILYADTRQELPPLQLGAMQVLELCRSWGYATQVVQPALDDRYFVYMFGRGVPPPKNRFRWCTPQLKIEPMHAALAELRQRTGEKILMLTGVRVGESAARDDRIALACGRDGAECGQGWFQETTPESIADTLAPLLHWRVCHVWDFLTFGSRPRYELYHGLPTDLVGLVYGGDEAEERNARTGCIGCPLATKDQALDNLLRLPDWSYLAPLKRLRPLYQELWKFQHRLQKNGERKKDGNLSSNPNRKGPLTFEARRWALGEVLAIQFEVNAAAARDSRPQIDLINEHERERIEALIDAGTWPDGWDGTEPRGDKLLRQVKGEGIAQELLLTLEEE